MNGEQIHQLLHGYRRGHQLLAGSIKLPPDHAELVTRLSDLSGLLTNETDFDPYLTAYPLTNGEFYALAKTWPDHQAARAGCVYTHTLLIPSSTWSIAKDPNVFANLLSAPGDNLDQYKKPIDSDDFRLKQKGHVIFPPINSPELKRLSSYVAKYFGEGLRPIVWFDQPSPNDLFWMLVRAIWPELRQQFACCTFSLQPRELENRPFDLLFAPSYVYSRFNKIPPENIIEASTHSQHQANINSKEEAWFLDLAKAIFTNDKQSTVAKELSEFGPLLGKEPTAIRNTFLIRSLRDRVQDSPTAGIGLMDVVATMAPSETQAREYKAEVVSLALNSAGEASEISESLKCYFLISERLEQPAYKQIPQSIIKELKSSVIAITENDPEAAINAGERLFVHSSSIAKSPYASGLISGLSNIARTFPEKLNALHRFPIAAESIICMKPIIAQGYLRGMQSLNETATASMDLVSWMSSISIPEKRAELRTVLVPHLVSDEESVLVEEILVDVPTSEVAAILSTLFDSTDGFSPKSIRQVISERLARPYPEQVRRWGNSAKDWSWGVAEVIASSYSSNIEGFRDLLQTDLGDGVRHTQLITAFLLMASSPSLPMWFREYARHHADFLVPLTASMEKMSSETLKLLDRVFSDVRDIPIAQESSLLKCVEQSVDTSFGVNFVDMAMRSAVGGFISGSLNRASYERWESPSWARKWFSIVNSWELDSLVTNSCREQSSWARAWEWLTLASDDLYRKSPPILPKLIGNLIVAKRYNWDWGTDTSNSWGEILRRSSKLSDASTYLELCSTALEFAFRNTQYPLSRIVVETFSDVYATVSEGDGRNHTRSLFSMFSWLDWDWDKAKDLRKKLINAFLYSNWPPGDLALAARDQQLLRKIFKRLIRQRNGERYVEAMIKDLRNRDNQHATSLAEQLTALLQSPNFYEPWD